MTEKDAFMAAPRWFRDINDIFGNDGENYLCFTPAELAEWADACRAAGMRGLAEEIKAITVTGDYDEGYGDCLMSNLGSENGEEIDAALARTLESRAQKAAPPSS